jgi:Caspase domain
MKNRLDLVLLACLAFVLPALGPGSFFGTIAGNTMRSKIAAQSHGTSPAATPTKLALLVGINNYEYADRIPRLAGSINDVEDIRQVLIGKFEFLPENILVLKDSEATHAGIMNAIQNHLIAKTHAGDIVVFHYSGHGSQMKDPTGKMINGVDETIVPYDSRDPEGKVFDISGAELHAALVQLAAKTKNLTFILDSCHSGTLVRGARVRSIPADSRILPSQKTTERSLNPNDGGTSLKFAFISAATSNESAFEYFSEGKDHGSLTYFLARQLRSASAGATYRDVMDSVIANVTGNFPTQHPSLEGAEADQHIFGDGGSLAGVYVTASPSLLDPKRVTLGIGQVQGATPESVYDIYAPGSKKFAPPEQPTAKVQLVSVNALNSEAVILAGGRIVSASRAVEREHRYGSSRTRVYLEGIERSRTLKSIRDTLQSIKYIEIVDNPTLCNLQLREAAQSVQMLAADSSVLSSVTVNDSSAVDRVVEQLEAWAKWFNVLSIRNTRSAISVSFSIRGSHTRDPLAQTGRPDVEVLEGETIDSTFTNNSDKDLYIAMLDLSSDGSISVVFPSQQGADEVLKSHLTVSKSFKTFLPKGRSSATDVLKVFASDKPIDLTPVTQGRIRGESQDNGELDSLQELLMDSTGVNRGVAPLLSRPLDLGTWTTVQRVLLVRHKG